MERNGNDPETAGVGEATEGVGTGNRKWGTLISEYVNM
jgi:hypothetical protein